MTAPASSDPAGHGASQAVRRGPGGSERRRRRHRSGPAWVSLTMAGCHPTPIGAAPAGMSAGMSTVP